MINPPRSSLPSNISFSDSLNDVVLTLHSEQLSVTVAHDDFSIGSHRLCDLKLIDPSIPPLHSVIHTQSGAIWIEAANDETVLVVNDRSCRRMALRDGDHFRVGASVFTIDLGAESLEALKSSALQEELKEDLGLLNAEELCDRIVTEQTMIQELSEGQRSGWEALLHAIEAVHEEPMHCEVAAELTIPLVEDQVAYDALFGQIQELQEAIADGSKELSEQEAEVIASSSILEDSQQRVTQRLDEILEQLAKSDSPNELRASA
jgi:hypothetical protein